MRSEGVKALIEEYRFQSSGDPWGDTVSALFCLCDELHCRLYVDESITWDSDEAESAVNFLDNEAVYRSAAVPRDQFRAFIVEENDLWAEVYAEASAADLLTFGRMLNRLSAILKAQGKDY